MTTRPYQLPERLPLSRPLIGAYLVAATFLLSAIVSSEPAPADALMAGLIIALPMLGLVSFGSFTILQSCLWLVIIATSLLTAAQLDSPEEAIKHQVITLFLAASAVVIAGYIRSYAEERFHLIMACFVISMAVASVFAIIGKLGLIPGTQELFTSYGRGRGTFKDPNVLGAALVPAIAYLFWMVMRRHRVPVILVSGFAGAFALALLFSFSRGAWLAAVVCLLVLGAGIALNSRRRTDIQRLQAVAITGAVLMGIGFVLALQNEAVRNLLHERASLSQAYDHGPDGRFAGQSKALDLVIQNPFGIGAKVFARDHHHEAPHQVYLSMFLSAGWIGGFCFLVSVLTTLAVGIRISMRRNRHQGAALIATSAFFALSVEGAIIDSDHWRHLFMLMGLIWGLADARPAKVDHNKRRTDWNRAGD